MQSGSFNAKYNYRAPMINKSKRSASRDKLSYGRRDPSPTDFGHAIPLTPTLARKKLAPSDGSDNTVTTTKSNHNLIKGTPLRSSTRRSSSVKRPEQLSSGSDIYDPYKSAEKQMNELLEPEVEPPKLAPIVNPPNILSSPTSAFTKFSPSNTSQPLFISEDDDDNSNRSIKSSCETLSRRSSIKSTSPLIPLHDNLSSSQDLNHNPISLSTLSLCSTISIESVDGNKNGLRLGYSSSAKTSEKKTPVPLRRTVSAIDSRRPKDAMKGKLKMEDLLYGAPNKGSERYFGSPIITGQIEQSVDNHSSSGSLFKPVYDAEKFNAEQELLKSMCEFEKLLSSSSSSSPSPSSPSSKLFPSLVSRTSDLQKSLSEEDRHTVVQSSGPDSAYSSLNRKSPVGGEGDHVKEAPEGGTGVARFCHECGTKYPVLAAKFCCQCGVRRLVI